MGTVQISATVLAAAVTVVAVVLAVRAVVIMTSVIRQGRPDPGRFRAKGVRTRTMLVETAGHTRMLKWGVVGAAHWFVMVSFIILFLLVLEAYFEVVDPSGGLPVVGGWVVYGLVTEVIGILGLVGILYRAEPDDGRGLAPVPGVRDHLLQTQPFEARGFGSRRAQADDERRQAAGLRGGRPGEGPV